MGLMFLLLDCLRVGLLAMPMVAIQLTARSDENAIALLLLWTPFFFRSIGYDVVRHIWGTEASIYFSLVVYLKTASFVSFVWLSVYLWGAVLALETL